MKNCHSHTLRHMNMGKKKRPHNLLTGCGELYFGIKTEGVKNNEFK